jgi:hypothetical protein
MTYPKSLRAALTHVHEARTQLDPKKLGIPEGSNREAALISSLELVEDLLKLRMGA